MPCLDVTYPAGSLDPVTRTELAESLTKTFMHWEGAPDTDFFREQCWIYFHELPEGMVNRAGVPTEVPIYRVNATVPAGAMSDRRKAGLVKDVTDLLLKADGGDPNPLRVWVLIAEVPDGNWGAAGQVIQFEQLREEAKAQREQAATEG